MFSMTTTMFYMLSAYIAFLIGHSADLHLLLVLLVPVGFVVGYLLDRLNSLKKYWVEDRPKIYRLVIRKYLYFLCIAGIFCGAGFFMIGRL